MLYTIGEIAKCLGLPTSTLRFYEKKGILPSVERSKGGVRMFTDKDYECLKVVECLKASGLPLKEISAFIAMLKQGDASIEKRLKLFEKRREEVEKQIEALHAIHDTLDYKCWYYETAKKAGTTKVVENMQPSELPEKFREIRERLKSQ